MTSDAYFLDGPDRPGRWIITCDHASNRVPPEINGGDLGIAPEDMERHIAYDIGAKGVSLRLGALMNAPVIGTDFSRLVIDPNRGEDDPTLVMRLYDGTIVPANRHIGHAETVRRIQSYYQPYHTALAELAASHTDPILVAVHSFSPKLNGRQPRPWHIGVLHAPQEDRFGIPLIERLRQEPDWIVGDNEPYAGHLPGDSMDRHALIPGRLNALIEIRQDLIASEDGQQEWAERLAPILQDVLASTGL